jgi:hypothetical protein
MPENKKSRRPAVVTALLAVSCIVVFVGSAFNSVRTQAAIDMEASRPMIALPADGVSLPMPAGAPSQTTNAYDDYSLAQAMMKDEGKVYYASFGLHPASRCYSSDDRDYTVAEKNILVRDNMAALQQLRAGFGHPYSPPPAHTFSAFAMDRPYATLARLTNLAAQVKAKRGDAAGAVDTDLDAVKLGETCMHDAPAISMLAGCDCQQIGRWGIWDRLGQLNGDQARASGARLRSIDSSMVSYADVIRQSQRAERDTMNAVLAQPDWRTAFARHMPQARPGDAPDTMTTVHAASKEEFLKEYAARMDSLVAYANKSYAADYNPPGTTDPVVTTLTDGYVVKRAYYAINETGNALLITAFALRAYYADHDGYPADLNALVPNYLPKLESDPFTAGTPLRYRNAGAKYLLYSIGPDGRDDGGKPIVGREKFPGRPNHMATADSTGDIVAGINR